MSFHLLNYNASAAGINTVNLDFTAATDSEFSQRNGHYVFTENYRLFASAMVGASVVRGRYQVPTWNAIGEAIIFNANRSLQPPSNPQYDLFQAYPLPIPRNEEFQVQVSNNLGAATEIENVPLIIVPDDWNANLPQSSKRPPIIPIRTSFTVTPTLNAWSGPQALTFSQSLRGGVYSVVAAICQGSNSVAFRLVFPRQRMYNNRKLRPGWLTQNAVGDVISAQFDPWLLAMGEWGQFHTFEPVQAEVFGTAASSTTYQLFMWLVWMGEEALLYGAPFMGGQAA